MNTFGVPHEAPSHDHARLFSLLFGKGDTKSAILDFDEALRLAPGRQTAYLGRAVARRRDGDFVLAISDLDEILRVSPSELQALQERTRCWIDLHDYRSAHDDADKVIDLDPKKAEGYRLRAITLANEGNVSAAETDATHAVSLEPSNSEGFSIRALVRAAMHEYAGSILDCNRAIELDANNVSAYRFRAVARLGSRDPDGAIRDATTVLERDPTNGDALLVRALAYSERDMFEDATDDFKRVVDLYSQRIDALANYAWLLATCKDLQFRDGGKAREYATRACRLTRWADPASLSVLAAACAEAGDPAGAVRFAEACLRRAERGTELQSRVTKWLTIFRSGKKL